MFKSSNGEVKSLSSRFINYTPLPTATFRIIPDYNVDNSNNDSIAHAISCMYRTPKQRLDVRSMGLASSKKVYSDILLKPKHANFYLTTDYEFKDLIESKMKTIWSKSNIASVPGAELKDFNFTNTEVCELVLKDYNFKSLNTDRGNLYPLTNMMGVLRGLKEGEQIRINIAIEPIKRLNWVSNAKDEIKSYQKGKVVNNEMNKKEKLMKLGFTSAEALVNLYIDYKLLIFESLLGVVVPSKKEDDKLKVEVNLDSLESIKQENLLKGLSSNTFYKQTAETFKTRITIISQSSDKNRAKLNMLSVANSYKDLTGDNELVIKLLSKPEQMDLFKEVMEYHVPTSRKCILSDKEVAKLIQLPQKDLQNEFKIESIDTREVDVPEQLQNGPVRIGIAEKQGKEIVATWCQHINVMSLGKLFVGGQGCGKTTAIKRTVKDCYKAGYSNIVIDYIESCSTAQEIAEVIPDKDKVIIKLGEKNFIPSLAYNEVSRLITEDMDTWERVRLANLIAEQVEYLINAVTDSSTGELTAPMLRYLHSACMITFIKPGAKISDVLTILRRWDKRNEAIRYARYSKCFDKDDDIFFDLEELHKRDKEGTIIGTRDDLIVGILNRIIILQKNPFIKAMLQADVDTTQDFTRYIEEGKSIFIMIPQSKFPSPVIRDILTTFFISRIWLTVQLRENNADARLCNVIFDEVHQVPTTARFLSNHVTEFRRHRLGLILSCHYLKQLKDLLTAFKSSGASYVLLAGTEKENLEALKEELLPFTVEDGLNLKPRTSLNIVNYGNQYARFITSLPLN